MEILSPINQQQSTTIGTINNNNNNNNETSILTKPLVNSSGGKPPLSVSVLTSSYGSMTSDMQSENGGDDLEDGYDLSDSDSSESKMTLEDELIHSKASLAQAKLTIASLIEQISDYQSLVEDEKEREKQEFILHLEEMEDEIEQLKKEKNQLAHSNIKNLETLMKEIETIEETNNDLQEQLDSEKKQHNEAIQTIYQLKEELLKKNFDLSTGNLPNQQQQILQQKTHSQVLLEFQVSSGLISNIKLLSSSNLNSTYSKDTLPQLQQKVSVIEIEDEKTQLQKKLLEEKESHEKTSQQLNEEKSKVESSKSSIDELIKKIRELIKDHTNVLKELEEEKSVNQQLRLQISRPIVLGGNGGVHAPKLNRTHSTYILSQLQQQQRNRSSTICPDPIGILSNSSSSSSTNSNASSPVTDHKKSLVTSSLPPKPNQQPTHTVSNENVSILGGGQISNSISNSSIASTDSNSSGFQNQISSSSSTGAVSGLSLSNDNISTTTVTHPDLLRRSNEGRLLKRSAALLDLNNRRNTKSSTDNNEFFLSWLSVDPAPAPIQCMVEVGKQVWVGCSDGSIRIIDKETGATIATRQGHQPNGIYIMIVVGKTVWSSSRDSKIKIWSSKSGKLIKELDGHSSHVTALLLVGNSVWSISADMAIRIWSTNSYKCCKKIETKNYLVSMAKVGNHIWVGTESSILRFDSNTYEQIDVLHGHKKMVHCIILVDDIVWSCSSDNLIFLWDPKTGKNIKVLRDHKSRVFYLLRVNGHVWSCAWDKTIKIHDIKTLELVKEIEPVHRDALSCLITIRPTSGNGASVGGTTQIWSGSWDHTVVIWKSSDPTPPPSPTNMNNGTVNIPLGLEQYVSTQKKAKESSTQSNQSSNKRGSVRLSLFSFGGSKQELSQPQPSQSQLIPLTSLPSGNNISSSFAEHNISSNSLMSRLNSIESGASLGTFLQQPQVPHDLLKQSLAQSTQCIICQSKIKSKKQVFHCRNCQGYFHSGECVEKSLYNSCTGASNVNK
ncbi:hypothetical protein DLAC_09247 [Tieghemostelium lacteum]|uniref:Uncharacterized protein n=1 Tax=Tieghemostelium lacteum TaxID=361077 RepID=A0A151Z9J4_TIELA|nr:hypothetical protein DLAC_09247 [Tieghemostelium lacteum]|eukprot:KYQ90618.1 hypothetical protein DLAC_09247 [Tieghemostelium lacteum]